tara:strand:- start:663 stop:1820 length:1158 start_codon:yes stop_codon:yes gene_type:complete
VKEFQNRISEIKKDGRYRTRIATQSAQDVIIKIKNEYINNFSSNNYLNLSNSPYLIKKMKKHLSKYGVGSGASPLISGYSDAHLRLENRLSKLMGFQSTLVSNSGYLTNVGLLNAITEKKVDVFQDRENHNSIVESTRLSSSRLIRYKHLDYHDLETKIITSNSNKKIIFIDSVFSMTGEKYDLEILSRIAKKYGCLLFVDDAHGFGTVREDRRLFPSSLNGIRKDKVKIDAYIGTFGKAIGTFGAFVCGSKSLIELLIQKSKPYIYSTALPAAVVNTTLDSINYIMKNKILSTKLEDNILFFKKLANDNHIKLNESHTQIQTITIGDPKKVMEIHKKALSSKIYLQAIRYPTVPLNRDLLRINLTSGHSKKQIQSLVEFLKNTL